MSDHPEKSFDELQNLIHSPNLLIVTATPVETFHVRRSMSSLPEFDDVVKVPYKTHTYFVGKFGAFPVVHVQCIEMAAHTQGGSILTVNEAIQAWNPKAVVMIGVAMGIDETEKKQKIGDVLVSESVIDYELEKLSTNGNIPRGNISQAGQILLDRFKNVTGWHQVIDDNGTVARMLPGHILSGGKLIDNLRERNALLKKYRHAIGKEMEGAGIYAACSRAQIQQWILVKGICDWGDGNKSVDKEKRQNIAAQAATSLCLKVFSTKNGLDIIGLIPATEKPVLSTHENKTQELVIGILDELSEEEKKADMATPIQSIIEAYLKMNSIDKLNIIKASGISLESLMNYSGHEMDIVFFQKVKQSNLLAKVWDAINSIHPFSTNQNPFIK